MANADGMLQKVHEAVSRARGSAVVHKIDVVGAVIVRGGLVLCAQRGFDAQLSGLWEFPGGKVEAGEDARTALEREIREELQMEIVAGALIATTVHAYDFAEVTLSTFYCECLRGEPVLSDHQAVAWLPPAELGSLDWAPADVPTVDLVIDGSTQMD